MKKVQTTREVFLAEGPAWVNPTWRNRFPWLAQGVTGGEGRETSRNFALATLGGPAIREFSPVLSVPAPWRELLESLGLNRLVLSRQVHGGEVMVRASVPRGVHGEGEGDGHVTADAGLLLGITVADCVPVFLVDPEIRAVALLHAGWRGIAAGILEEGLAVLARRFGSSASRIHLHLGPSICGACYEVGPEVHRALGLPVPPAPEPVDLRRILAARARRAGISHEKVSRSAWCTLCGDSPFFSHRAGDSERQLAFLGIRDGKRG